MKYGNTTTFNVMYGLMLGVVLETFDSLGDKHTYINLENVKRVNGYFDKNKQQP